MIEYTIEGETEQKTYRLITSLMDIVLFPAILLATVSLTEGQYINPTLRAATPTGCRAPQVNNVGKRESTIDQLKTHLNGRKTPILTEGQKNVLLIPVGWYCKQKHPKFMVGY